LSLPNRNHQNHQNQNQNRQIPSRSKPRNRKAPR
jgi:hypothetical protein